MVDILTLRVPGQEPQCWNLYRHRKYSIGSSRGADIFVALPDIASEHVRLGFYPRIGEWVLRNLGDTYVDGELLTPRSRAPLFNGSFALGDPDCYAFTIEKGGRPTEIML